MSESSRYRGALRYDPSRSVGMYPDSRDISQLPIVPVGSRTPLQFAPRLSTVATTDPVLLGAPPEVVFGDIPYLPEPVVPPQTDGEMGEPGVNMLGLLARYGPRVANELMKRLRPDEDPSGVLANPGGVPVVPWGGDQFGYVPQGAHPFGDGGVYWSPQGIPDFNGAIVPGPSPAASWGGTGDFNYVPQGSGPFGGGVYMAPNGSEGLLDGAIVPKTDAVPMSVPGGDTGGLGLGDLSLSGFRDAIGTGALAGAMSGQLIDSFGPVGGPIAGAAMSAGAGYLGTNAAYALQDENGSPDNIGHGAAAGAAIGSMVLPIFGTAVGALLGGLAGGTINPQPDYQSAFAQFGINPQGGMDASGIVRNGAPQGTADNLAQQAAQYWAERAAAEGYAPNAAMMNQGFRFGVGQGANGFGGWFLQPFAGDPNESDVRPDNFALLSGPVSLNQDNVMPLWQAALAGNTPQGNPTPGFPTAPQDFGQALDYGWNTLVNQGFYAPVGSGPSPQDVAANIDAQRAWAAANPQQIETGGDSAGWMPVPWPDQWTYNPGWAPPGAAQPAPQEMPRGWLTDAGIDTSGGG